MEIYEKDRKRGVQLTHLNARELYKSALLLKEAGQYGCASSLMVLSAEECVKAINIGLNLNRKEWGFDLNKVFKDHGYKHSEAARILSLTHWIQVLCTDTGEHKCDIDTCPIQKSFREWEIIANNVKKNGFYVDYKEGNWITPNMIDEEIFEKLRIQTDWLLSIVDVRLWPSKSI